MQKNIECPHIVIVGGGAGGLELATMLGNSLGKKQLAHITLVDVGMTHIWKPLLHEVAAGTLNAYTDEVSYVSHAHRHHFHFMLGRMHGLDVAAKELRLDAVMEGAIEVIPPRVMTYDYLVVSIGSTANNFGTPGADDYCFYLDQRAQADKFQQTLVREFIRAHTLEQEHSLSIGIVGAGATGVELAAELRTAAKIAYDYGMKNLDPQHDIDITLIEAAPRILPPMSERVAAAALKELKELDINVVTGEVVDSINQQGFSTKSGKKIPAKLKVWAAGVKAPEFLSRIDGVETNGRHQLIVNEFLQTTQCNEIYAIGDCSSYTDNTGNTLGPRAQVAHQQAVYLTKSIRRRILKKPIKPFEFNDYGALVSISTQSTVGALMGNLTGTFFLEGYLARITYLSLYKKHQMALHGFWPVALSTIGGLFAKSVKPRLKLH